jgi:hypothetical protein
MAITAVAQYTSAPLRKVFDISLGSSGDTGSLVIPHGISFSDVGTASVNQLMTVHQMQLGNTIGQWIVASVDATNVTLSLLSSYGANYSVGMGGVVNRVEVLRVHSIQG